ncbi:hypothetical protein EJ05DRAFT_471894, partial [Pseudovirgaria hyperparasitica]
MRDLAVYPRLRDATAKVEVKPFSSIPKPQASTSRGHHYKAQAEAKEQLVLVINQTEGRRRRSLTGNDGIPKPRAVLTPM